MKALRLASTLFLLGTAVAMAQGTFVFDQQSSTDETPPGPGPNWIALQDFPSGQSFTPALTGVDFIKLMFTDGNPNDAAGVTVHPVADALRIAATSLERSQSALGAFYRRMKAKLGAAEAVTATAHKLARFIYRLIKHGEAYVRQGMAAYEQKYHQRKLYALKRAATALGFELLEKKPLAQAVS